MPDDKNFNSLIYQDQLESPEANNNVVQKKNLLLDGITTNSVDKWVNVMSHPPA